MALPYLRQTFLRRARGLALPALRSLPPLRKFRSRTHSAQSRRAGNAGSRETLFGRPGLPLRSVPPALLQRSAVAPDRVVHCSGASRIPGTARSGKLIRQQYRSASLGNKLPQNATQGFSARAFIPRQGGAARRFRTSPLPQQKFLANHFADRHDRGDYVQPCIPPPALPRIHLTPPPSNDRGPSPRDVRVSRIFSASGVHPPRLDWRLVFDLLLGPLHPRVQARTRKPAACRCRDIYAVRETVTDRKPESSLRGPVP